MTQKEYSDLVMSAVEEELSLREKRKASLADKTEDVGSRRFATGAVRSNDVDHLRYDLIPHVALRRLAARYGMGAEKYGDHNYLKGIPYSNIINHLEAHLAKFKEERCANDDNLAAIAWAAFALMTFESLDRTDLDDLMSFTSKPQAERESFEQAFVRPD